MQSEEYTKNAAILKLNPFSTTFPIFSFIYFTVLVLTFHFHISNMTNRCEARVTTGASAIQHSFSWSINQSINLSVSWHFRYTQSINRLTTISKWVSSVGLKFFRVFIVFCTCRYISKAWLDGMSEGVVGMRELSAWPRVLVYRSMEDGKVLLKWSSTKAQQFSSTFPFFFRCDMIWKTFGTRVHQVAWAVFIECEHFLTSRKFSNFCQFLKGPTTAHWFQKLWPSWFISNFC